MAAGSPFPPQVHGLDSDSSFGDSNLFLRCDTCPQPMGVLTLTAHDSSISAFVLLRLGLSDTRSMFKPIGNYNAVLRLGRVFIRSVAGSKCIHEGSEKTQVRKQFISEQLTQGLMKAVTAKVRFGQTLHVRFADLGATTKQNPNSCNSMYQ